MKSDGIKCWEMEVVDTREPRVHAKEKPDGDWCAFEDVESLVDAITDQSQRHKKRIRHSDIEKRLILNRDLAAHKLMAHDIAHLFELLTLPLNDGAVFRLNEFVERFRDD